MEENRFILLEKRVDRKIFGSKKAELKNREN
jgi:hypothetical protein